MLVSISGTRDGVDWPLAGSVVDVPAAEGESLVSAGLAVPVDSVVVESAVVGGAPESAAVKAPRRRKSAE